jgi:hypothetical protein
MPAAIAFWMVRQWFNLAFERRLRLALAAIFLCSVGVAGIAYWTSRQSDYLLERVVAP